MSAKSGIKPKRPVVILACGVMEQPLEKLRNGNLRLEIRYLDQGLHRTPQKLAALLQKQIDEVSTYAAKIVVGYGLCGNGVIGVSARGPGLIMPRCHDCISFFLGSTAAYRKALKERPGTFYLLSSWITDRQEPLSIVEDCYTPRVGYETAVWAMKEELKHYTQFALVLANETDGDSVHSRAQENAAFFDKELLEIPINLQYFRKLIDGPYDEAEFFFVSPGETITQEMFFRATSNHPVLSTEDGCWGGIEHGPQ